MLSMCILSYGCMWEFRRVQGKRKSCLYSTQDIHKFTIVFLYTLTEMHTKLPALA